MKVAYSELPVDAGMIQIADYNHYKPYGFRRGRGPSASLDLPKGIYSVKYQVGDWRDNKGMAWLEVTSGHVWIGDPCYFVSKWEKYLKDTDYGNKMPAGAVHINTGGDGGFGALFEFEKWKPITNYAVRNVEVGDGEQTRLWEDPEYFIEGFREEDVPWGIISMVESLIKQKDVDGIDEWLLPYISHKDLHEEDFDRWEYYTWNDLEDWENYEEWADE